MDVQETRADVAELVSQQPDARHIPDETIAGAKVEPPPQRVEPVLEGIQPEDVATEIRDNIKEVYMIPGYVYPEYEPSVVEKFRFEPQVREHAPTQEELVRMHEIKMAAMAAQQTTLSREHIEMATVSTTSQMTSQATSHTQTQVVKMTVEAAEQGQHTIEVKMADEQTTKPEVITMATEMASHIVRAVQEVTEERQQVVEARHETVEIITKPKQEKHVTIESRVIESTPRVSEHSAVALMAPVFEIPLSDVTVVDGEKATLECRVTGTPTPSITWFCENQEVKASQDIRMLYEEGMCSLDIVDVLPEDEGEYRVEAVNEAGSCHTVAYLTVLRECSTTLL